MALRCADGRLLGDYREIGRGHAEIIIDMMKALLDEAGLSGGEVDRFGVTLGPGTFAGVRVGLSAMRGLALAARHLSKGQRGQVYGLSALHVLAAGRNPQDNPDGLPIAVLVDARRDQLYCQSFNADGVAENQPTALTVPVFCKTYQGRAMVLMGTGVEVLKQGLTASGLELGSRARASEWPAYWQVVGAPLYPNAKHLIPLVASMPKQPIDAPAPEPLYIRPPDAALPKKNQRLVRQDNTPES